MYCIKCGREIDDNAAFCPSCGTAVEGVNSYEAQEIAEPAVVFPMKWYKFLIYFALFAGAVLNLVNGISMLTGIQYGEDAALVYEFFGKLKILDVIVGIASVACVPVNLYTRSRLAKFCKNGPSMVTVNYICSIAVNLVYFIGVYVVLPEMVTESIDISSTVGGIVTSIVMIFVNRSYFKKRESLFVN